MRVTAHSQTGFSVFVSNLKLIGEELWLCHGDGITVYDCQWNTLREIMFGVWTKSVAALDTKTVVIAPRKGLVISSTSGMNVRVVDICMFWTLDTHCLRF